MAEILWQLNVKNVQLRMGKQSHPSHTVDGTISGPANILNITCSHSLSYSV